MAYKNTGGSHFGSSHFGLRNGASRPDPFWDLGGGEYRREQGLFDHLQLAAPRRGGSAGPGRRDRPPPREGAPALLLLFLCLSNKVETKAVWLRKNTTSNPKSSMDRMERSAAERRLLEEQQARAAARALAALLAQRQAARAAARAARARAAAAAAAAAARKRRGLCCLSSRSSILLLQKSFGKPSPMFILGRKRDFLLLPKSTSSRPGLPVCQQLALSTSSGGVAHWPSFWQNYKTCFLCCSRVSG